ncbi:type I-E CRISPR-associated protein Cse1/CasA [Pseudoduganella namucuonensis]|uniref:CRISPR-associated protein, Cse1 family n=1 Tax=Pseudoduganella namucuonensis TaxID=1035707 RepID=A0A1I7ETJ7_9BURK|nr:type I-E CRISPR-associated protein Cse1/CasA [Pseudoduganella namucuonensis]SFU27255.1 CRISPR-associated protein, Cse1 family [Pseudoduganella namucuonensis]
MSLLAEEWIPVLCRDGRMAWIAPHQISDPDVVALAANRADFNAALMQLLIGLLQTTTPVKNESDWVEWNDIPPSADVLQQWFSSVGGAFVLSGDGHRFMQDAHMSGGAECSIDALLIDAPGGSAVDKNTDHFVKRNTVQSMCPHCAATALFTLQTNAPAGGAGHRTSLRGGGPLTTLLVALQRRSLWHDIWLNVLPQREFMQHAGDAKKTAPHFTFPWLADITAIQAPGGETQPMQVHPHHVFWAMPRRIRLDFGEAREGVCDICKRVSTQLISRYFTKPQGLNYKGPWRHPASPYYETKEGWLPVHPQPTGFSYRNWLAWVLGSSQSKKEVQAATILSYFVAERRLRPSSDIRLWISGYDMDNMKPRCWYETTFPLYSLPRDSRTARKNLQELIKRLLEAAELAAFYLRQAVKHAWFGELDARGDLSFVDKAFWDTTEIDFYQLLKAAMHSVSMEASEQEGFPQFAMRFGEKWHTALFAKSLELFSKDIVGLTSQGNPRRVAEAHRRLRGALTGKTIRDVLHLPVMEKRVSSSDPA